MMDSLEALRVVSRHRGEAIVVAAHTSSREWPQVSTRPELDLNYGPNQFGGCMGKASSVALGLALARPDRKVLLLDGDGSLLMNLGGLVTITNMAPANLVYFVCENGMYRATGGQPLPSVGKLDFTLIAKGAGFTSVYKFEALHDLEARLEAVLGAIGPTFVDLKLAPSNKRPPFGHVKPCLWQFRDLRKVS